MVHTRSVRVGNSSLPHGQGQPPNNLPPLIPPQLTPQLPPQVPIMFPPVDHVEGGDENQPHTSAHNSTSTANQDVVTAQLAAMQQQFGVFQLVLAQLLARNNPGAPPPHHAANSIPHPLNTNIKLEPYPAGFKIPQLETYDRTKDPDDHLHAFYSCMQAQNASNALMCKIFPSTLRGNARTWYYSLPPRSISSYTEMAFAFATKFSSRRFNDAVLEVSSFDQAVGIAAVISSLKHDRFRDSLIKHAATTFSEVNDRSLKFITAEEYALIKNKMDLRRPVPMKTIAVSRDHTRYCDFHQDHGHTTEQCNSLKSELESLAQRGMLNEYVQRAAQLRFVREQGPQPQGARDLEAGGLSSKQRKLYVKEVKHQNRAQKRKFDDAEWKNQPITFTSADLDIVITPHNDPLVTSVMINNCEKYDGPIYGFTNQPVLVEGVLTLHVAFGSGRTYFPTPMGIATLRGNQEVARHCYITSVTQPMKGKDQTPEAISQRILDNQQVMGVEIVDNRLEDETRVARVEDVEEVLIDDRDPTRKTQIGTKLNPEERTELIAFLRANNDVFAWTSADMPGIPNSISQHNRTPPAFTDTYFSRKLKSRRICSASPFPAAGCCWEISGFGCCVMSERKRGESRELAIFCQGRFSQIPVH
ncbi:hypothetical protein SLEP1_g16076 [Rubroshorea leprosula]|uniref:Retrotransposon gag domain-containing protein n=1 Tax=Rubroshorea leprosula TaxID=152421 RepID=A0AAV5J1A4_9ROSI|nr:hypothetical protein SLEP1_g16076 [Rubroshorea leprosula]